MHRRHLLSLAGVTVAAGGLAALAGCSSSCPDTDPPTPDTRVGIDGDPMGAFDEVPTGEWPTSHGAPGRTGYAAGDSIADPPALHWRTALELPATDAGGLSVSAPTVADGRVVLADSERVHALSLRSGDLLWRSERLSPTRVDAFVEYEADTVAPTVGPDGTVYVGGADGLVALDGTSGDVRWTVDELSSVASPAVVDGTTYARGRDAIAAVDPDGEVAWRRPVARTDWAVPPAASANAVVVLTERGARAFDPATGDRRWHRELSVESHPVLVDGTCLLGNYQGLHAFDAIAGSEQWTFTRGEHRSWLSPVVTGETIYAVEQPGEAGAASFALDRTDGRPEARWCAYIGSGAVLAATDDLALAALNVGEGPDAAHALVAFTRDLGQSPWALVSGSNPRRWLTPPAVVGGRVIAATRGGLVVALGGSTDG